MSELAGNPFEPPVEEAARAVEALQRHVSEASFLLSSWYGSRESDSVRRQEMRHTEYSQACEQLRSALHASRELGHELRVIVSEDSEPFQTRRMDKTPYDFIDVRRSHRDPIEPGGVFELKCERTLTNYNQRASNVYFGDYVHYLEVADIAEVLGNGGRLEAVPKEPDEVIEP